MAIYELLNPSDAITFEGEDDRVACAVGILLGAGKVGMRRVDAPQEAPEVLPILLMASEADTRAALQARGLDLVTLTDWLDDHSEAVIAFLESVLYGSPRDRDLFTALTDKMSADEVAAHRKRWNDRKRSSLNDYGAYALQLAQALRARRPAAKAG